MAGEATSPSQASSGQKESRSDDVIIILTVMQALSTIVVAARLLTRLLIQRMRLAADDWTIAVSWVVLVAYTVDVCIQTKFGLGKHLADLPADTNHAASLELFFYGEALYYITVSMTKVSILFLYLRVFPQQNYRVFNYCMMVFVIATGFSCTIAGIFQCNPIRRAWLTNLPGKCFNQVALFIANAGLNIAQDLIIYVLPIPMLWQVQRPLKQRLALIGVFVVGGFVCVTGMIRLKSLQLASISHDPTWDNYGAAVWSSIEANFGLICASLVHFKPLIKRFAPSLLGLSTRGSKGSKMVRLGDGSSGYPGSLKTFGQRQFNKPVGVLTQMELDDMEHDSLPHDTFGGSPSAYATAFVGNKKTFQESQEHLQGINATTHIDISSYTTQQATPGRATSEEIGNVTDGAWLHKNRYLVNGNKQSTPGMCRDKTWAITLTRYDFVLFCPPSFVAEVAETKSAADAKDSVSEGNTLDSFSIASLVRVMAQQVVGFAIWNHAPEQKRESEMTSVDLTNEKDLQIPCHRLNADGI